MQDLGFDVRCNDWQKDLVRLLSAYPPGTIIQKKQQAGQDERIRMVV